MTSIILSRCRDYTNALSGWDFGNSE